MKCENCGGRLETVDSRKAPLNTTRRNKRCKLCHATFTTYEYIGVYPTQTSFNTSPRARVHQGFCKQFMS